MENNQPIGTIISSVLHYDEFLEINGYQRTIDTSKVIWVPCDGRAVSGSKYATSQNGKYAPDLRGVFLRGINDYDVPGYNPNSNPKQLNPEDKKANEFQNDSIKRHSHTLNLFKFPYAWGKATDGVCSNEYKPTNGLKQVETDENIDGKNETRQKNITVYYYLKIN